MFELNKKQGEAVALRSIGTFTEYFGNRGILIIMMPVCIGYFVSLKYFEKLDAARSQLNKDSVSLSESTQAA